MLEHLLAANRRDLFESSHSTFRMLNGDDVIRSHTDDADTQCRVRTGHRVRFACTGLPADPQLTVGSRTMPFSVSTVLPLGRIGSSARAT
jgi:hypothetical protein